MTAGRRALPWTAIVGASLLGVSCRQVLGLDQLSFDLPASGGRPSAGGTHGSGGGGTVDTGGGAADSGDPGGDAATDAAPTCPGVNTSTDPQNCGTCGHACAVAEFHRVMRSPIEGGDAVALATGTDPAAATGGAITAWSPPRRDATNEYRADGQGHILKVPLSGGTPIVLASDQTDPVIVTIDDANVYWIDAGLLLGNFAVPSDVALRSVPQQGGTPKELWHASVTGGVGGLVAGGGSVYFLVNSGATLMTVSRDGGIPTTLAELGHPDSFGVSAPSSLAITVDAANVYWVDAARVGDTETSPSLMQVARGGGIPRKLATGADTGAIAVDAAGVYWLATSGGTAEPCSAGTCQCPGATALCLGVCVEPSADSTNCGTCGTYCAPGSTCQSGRCCPSTGCAALDAGGLQDACPDASTEPSRCTCTGACATDFSCENGHCVGAIATGQCFPIAIAVNSTNVYWINQCIAIGGSVMKAPLGGITGTPVIESLQGASGLALDATHVYVTTGAPDPGGPIVNVNDGTVLAVSLDGLQTKTLASGQGYPIAVAVDATNAYFTNYRSGTVMKVPLGGGNPTELAAGQTNPTAVAVDATSVYWTTGGGSIMKVAIGGGQPTTLASGQSNPTALAVDATSVYWTDYTAGTVMKVPRGGGQPTTLVSGRTFAAGLVLDSTHAYWVDESVVAKVPIGGGAFTVLASGQSQPSAVAVDATHVYWTNLVGNSVMRGFK